MGQRFVAIWFPHLLTDWMQRRKPEMKDRCFALALHEKNRRVIRAVNVNAQSRGVSTGMVVADARSFLPELLVLDYSPGQSGKLLQALAEWCIGFSPVVAVDEPDGLLLDATGCTHLWRGEQGYVDTIRQKISGFGYHVRVAMADTIGAAWAVCRFGAQAQIIPSGTEAAALSLLPAAALRLERQLVERLQKLGLRTVGSFTGMPRTALRRRFGAQMLMRIGQALGEELEILLPVRPVAPYQERLPSLEPIKTAGGIEVALKTVLEGLCKRLAAENKGLRKAVFCCHRIDGRVQRIETGTSRPSRNAAHLFRLFSNHIADIEPDLGIELFVVEATVVEELQNPQDALWNAAAAGELAIAELLDRLNGRTGGRSLHRYLPAEHYWPERSAKEAGSLAEQPSACWRHDLPRPLHLLPTPEPIEVSVPIPDYPPLLFRYKGKLHSVRKADGPERIEQEWWVQGGLYRDYYCVEDEQGARYWLFRSGDYARDDPEWFIHGFFS